MLDTCSLEGKKVLEYNGKPWSTLISAIKTRFPRKQYHTCSRKLD